MNVRFSLALVALGASLTAVVPADAQNRMHDLQNIGGFDRIRTDDIQYNLNSGDFTLKDHFSATRAGTDISADHANGNSRTKVLHAFGNVVVHQNAPLSGRGETSRLTQRPSTLTCDRLDVDGNSKVYTATGSVHFTQENRDARADMGTLNDTSSNLHLEGHVHIKDSERYLDADVVDYNTATGQVDARGNVDIRAPVETPPPFQRRTPAPKKRKK